MIEYININSNRTHSITFPYHNNEGRLAKVTIYPGDNKVEEKEWKAIKDQYKNRSPFYFRGLTKKGED